LLACIGLAVGLLHIYAGEEKLGGLLFLVACAGFGLSVAGQPLGSLLVIGVWLVDIIRGFILLSRYNAALERLSK